MTTTAIIEETRAMLALFERSPWRDLHLRTGDIEMFFALPGGSRNPMARPDTPLSEESVSDITAPHLGLFYPCVATGAAVTAASVVGQIEVLGARADIPAGRAGRVAALLVGEGALVEYATPLVRIAA